MSERRLVASGKAQIRVTELFPIFPRLATMQGKKEEERAQGEGSEAPAMLHGTEEPPADHL